VGESVVWANTDLLELMSTEVITFRFGPASSARARASRAVSAHPRRHNRRPVPRPEQHKDQKSDKARCLCVTEFAHSQRVYGRGLVAVNKAVRRSLGEASAMRLGVTGP
jgi:hypothetical protein